MMIELESTEQARRIWFVLFEKEKKNRHISRTAKLYLKDEGLEVNVSAFVGYIECVIQKTSDLDDLNPAQRDGIGSLTSHQVRYSFEIFQF